MSDYGVMLIYKRYKDSINLIGKIIKLQCSNKRIIEGLKGINLGNNVVQNKRAYFCTKTTKVST